MSEYPEWFEELVKKHKKEGFKAGEILAVEPQLFKRFINHLSKWVVHDVPTKTLVFLTALSAYTKNPINLFLRGESSIGKTYNVTQALMYLPEEDVWSLGGLSPTALVHDYGILIDRKGNEIDFSDRPLTRRPRKRKKETQEQFQKRLEDWQRQNKEWAERMRGSRYIVDLHKKILVFLDAPHIGTYNKLRPILSHDKEEISYKFTGKTAGGQLRTMHVVLQGWPATIFLSTEEEYIEDLATRSFTATPESHETKIRDAIRLKGDEKAFPWKYKKDPEWMLLHGYVGFLKNQLEELRVVNPFARELAECYPTFMPRCMRDFDHVTALIDVSALFHCYQRPVLAVGEEKYVLCTLRDLSLVMSILPQIEETTLTGLPGHMLDCFHKVIEPLYKERGTFDYAALTERYNQVFHRKKSSSTLRKYVMLLGQVGYIDTLPDPSDKRKTLIMVIRKLDENVFDSVIHRFSDSFTPEKFKAWFNEIKKSVLQNPKVLMPKMTSEHEADIQAIYEEHYSPTLLALEPSAPKEQISEYASKPVEGVKPQKKIEDMFRTEKNRILGISPKRRDRKPALGDVVSKLRREWTRDLETDEFMKRLEELTSSPIEAKSLFNQLAGSELFWYDKDDKTFWRWVK